MKGDPLRGINVDAAGGAGKVLRMLAEKVGCSMERPSAVADALDTD
jgi:peptidyl-prolyl cis-trans isomerase-like protein 2